MIDFYPLKAQFIPNEKIEMCVELEYDESCDEGKAFRLEVVVTHLGAIKEVLNYEIYFAVKNKRSINIDISGKYDDNEGYGIDIFVYKDQRIVAAAESSFDVVSDYRKAVRYGFLSDFYLKDIDDEEDVKNLCKLHINTVQFYDWMYRHDDLIPKESEFKDLMGRTISFNVVKQKIEMCHNYGIKAIAYGAIYAASKEFYGAHKELALYNSDDKPYDFINIFYIMNISKDSPWQSHIIEEYAKAIAIGFDGIHMDTYGFPKTAVSKMKNMDRLEYLEEEFPNLIDHAKNVLTKNKKDVSLIFNNVGNWPVNHTAASKVDCLYIEVWSPYERYHHIQQIIQEAKRSADGRPVILAAYLKPFRSEEVHRANTAALILTAVIAANGANHLLLGENKGVLTQGYYVDYSVLQEEFFIQIRKYYDFIVRYSSLFYDTSMIDVSMTHAYGDNKEYEFENGTFSPYGEPGKIWTIIRENRDRSLISLINLTNNEEDYWNVGKLDPDEVNNIIVKLGILKNVKRVFIASPDSSIKEETVKYGVVNGARGKSIIIEVPRLHLWSILFIEFNRESEI